MDDLGFNKIAAAVLATALGFLGVRTLGHTVVHEPEFTATYVPEVDVGDDDVVDEVVIGWNHPDFIAAMNVAEGEKVFKKCQSCHNAERGGANGTGPNLWGVMGRQMGVHQGFAYSSAMQGRAAPWTWEEMDGFLTKPKEWLPGTAMNYIGLKKYEQRAAVMAYLNANTDNPLPMPEPVLPEADITAGVEPGDLPDSQPVQDVLYGDGDGTEARIVDEPKDEGIPGQMGGEEALAINDGGEGADDVTMAEALGTDGDDGDEDAREDDFVSAGEVTPEDLDPAVRAAIPGEQPSEDVEVVDGPMEADDVMKFLDRNRGRDN